MIFEFSNVNTQYNNSSADAIAAIMKENASAANSNIASVYEASDIDIDAAVLSISDKGISRILSLYILFFLIISFFPQHLKITIENLSSNSVSFLFPRILPNQNKNKKWF